MNSRHAISCRHAIAAITYYAIFGQLAFNSYEYYWPVSFQPTGLADIISPILRFRYCHIY